MNQNGKNPMMNTRLVPELLRLSDYFLNGEKFFDYKLLLSIFEDGKQSTESYSAAHHTLTQIELTKLI